MYMNLLSSYTAAAVLGNIILDYFCKIRGRGGQLDEPGEVTPRLAAR